MSDALLTWVLGILAVSISGSLGFSWRCANNNSAEIERLKAAYGAKIENLTLALASANASATERVTKATEELYSYKVHVAEHFASVTYAAAIERRTADALDEIKRTLKGQSEKLDRLVEGRPK
jgi:hypothetical protein